MTEPFELAARACLLLVSLDPRSFELGGEPRRVGPDRRERSLGLRERLLDLAGRMLGGAADFALVGDRQLQSRELRRGAFGVAARSDRGLVRVPPHGVEPLPRLAQLAQGAVPLALDVGDAVLELADLVVADRAARSLVVPLA
ncbi:MAG: hypothetical protein IPK07_20930 [Deltaproteobacteria bacterium]|nr:hypothetical protein [Deltaproteobacteria bacterium]